MKSTKKRLISSVLALIMCVCMLIGTTFAWFTDSVTSGKNRIVAGNLDVEMFYKNASTANATDGGAGWANVETAPTVKPTFFVDKEGNDILWEPDVVAYANFKVANVGNLALKYNFTTVASAFNTPADATDKSLKDVIKFAVISGDKSYNTREDALAAATTEGVSFADMESFGYNGSLLPKGQGINEELFTVIAYWEPNDNAIDNIYNLNNGRAASDGNTVDGEPMLFIDLEINLFATQLQSESDSFDKTYDAGAPWTGETNAVEAKDGVYVVSYASELAWVAQQINAGALNGANIKLAKDINLNNLEWTQINGAGKNVTLDGDGHTISNLKVSSGHNAGMFSTGSGCTIKNLTVDGASVTGVGRIAVICGHGMCVTVDKCTVKNATVTAVVTNNDDGDKAGAIVGYLSGEPNAKVTNCVVENCTVQGYRDIGGLVGYAGGTYTVTGNTVKDCTVINDQTNNYKNYTGSAFDANEIIGEQGASGTVNGNTATNVTVSSLIPATPETVVEALQDAKPGDTVKLPASDQKYVLPEKYEVAEGVSIVGEEGTVLKVTGDGGNIQGISALQLKNDDITISNVTIEASKIGNDQYNSAVRITGDNVTLDNVTIKSTNYSAPIVIGNNASNDNTITIKDCTIDAAFKAIHIVDGSKGTIIIDNCNINAVYPFNVNTGDSSQEIIVKDSTLNGWTSYGTTVTKASFTNCSFGIGHGYGVVMAYANTEFVDCTFSEGFTVYASAGLAKTMTFTNCNVAGTAITADNVKTIFADNTDSDSLANCGWTIVAN